MKLEGEYVYNGLRQDVWDIIRDPEVLDTALLGAQKLNKDDEQVVATMGKEEQQSALSFLQASRSGSGFLHGLHHHCGDLSRIKTPTLIIESKYDESVDATHASYAADHIPDAEIYVSPIESHLMWFSSYNIAI